MGLDVVVREYSGETVERLEGPADVAALCLLAAREPVAYPLLAGVDPVDDTYFNRRQAVRLKAELKDVAERCGDGGVSNAAAEILRLLALLEPAPGRPTHRLLIFVGD